MSPGRPAVFLDRDGTLMEEVDYCSDPATVRVFAGVREALAKLKQRGFLNVIITNQSGIGRGYFSEEDYHLVHEEFLRQAGAELIDAMYYCGDHPDQASTRRKPEPGMVLEAAGEHGIDLARSFLVGDKHSDVECGRRAGVKTILVQTGYGSAQAGVPADYVAADFRDAAAFILRETEPVA